MSNIVELKTQPAKIRDSVVERLEEALEQAREGAITCVAIAVVRPNGAIYGCWSDTDDFGRLTGALATLQQRVIWRGTEEA